MTFKQEILPAVAAAIFNEKGEVLLQRRSDTDQWCIISGHVEFGETVQEAVLREIKEETDVRAEIVRLIGIYSSPASQVYHYPERTVQYITSYFEVRLQDSIAEGYTNEETHELRFFPADGLPAEMGMISPYWLSDALDRERAPFTR